MPTTTSSTALRRGLTILAVLAFGVGGAACSRGANDETRQAPPSPPPSTVVRPTDTVDELVAITGGRLHLRCAGSGDTTVVLVAGWGDGGESWQAVEDAGAHEARVCSYAKFGTGTSDPPATDQSFLTQADELDELLRVAGEPGPYVVAGHSFGGATAVAFAAKHPDDVRGLLLVDATPVDWITAACAVPDDRSTTAAIFRATCDMATNPAANTERLDAARGFAALAEAVTSLGSLPTIVLVPSTPTSYDDLTPSAADRLRQVKADGTKRWATLSSDSRILQVDGTGHTIQVDRPDVVVAQLHALLDD